jgi:hypothetical protein
LAAAVASLSNTKNVDRLTSESSSSPRVTVEGRAVCFDDVSGAGVAADAPPTIAKDMPAAPHTGKAIFGRFFGACFVRAMDRVSVPVSNFQRVSLR